MFKESAYEEFTWFAREKQVIPIYREMMADWLTPVTAFNRVCKGKDAAFLLENVDGGRYSYLGRDPFLTLRIRGTRIQVEKRHETFVLSDDPVETIRKIIFKYRRARVEGLPPFVSGMVGFFGYDAYRWLLNVVDVHPSDQTIDDAILMFYSTLLVFDHWTGKLTLIYNVFPDQHAHKTLDVQFDEAQDFMDRIENNLIFPIRPVPESAAKEPSVKLAPRYSAAEFEQMIARAQQHIFQSEVEYLTLSNPVYGRLTAPASHVYRALRFNYGGVSTAYMLQNQQHVMNFDLQPLFKTQERAIYKPVTTASPAPSEASSLLHLNPQHYWEKTDKLDHNQDGLDVLFKQFPPFHLCGEPQLPALEFIDMIEEHRRGVAGGATVLLDVSGNMAAYCSTQIALYQRQKLSFDNLRRITVDTDPKQMQTEFDEHIQELADWLEFSYQDMI